MDLQEAVVAVIEGWRLKQGLTQMDLGRVIAPKSTEAKIAGQKWAHVVSGRKATGKKRTLSLKELDALARFFGVNPETIIIEARARLRSNAEGDDSKTRRTA